MDLGAVLRRRPHGRPADAALAGGVFLLVAAGSIRPFIGERRESWPVTALGWLLIAAACGALYFRRRRPVAVTALVLAATTAYYLTSVYDGPLMIALVVALYAVAASGRLQTAIALAALIVICVAAGTLAGNRDVNGVALFMLTGWLVAVVALGWVRFSRLAFARAGEQRAVSEERLRIARELHDVLGHHISLINVQAGAALHRCRTPTRAEPALAAIKQASRETLRELRATLGVLRQVDEDAPTAPSPAWTASRDLVATAGGPGWTVRTELAASPAAAAGGRPGGVPDRAGGADQRDPPRRRHRGRGPRRPDGDDVAVEIEDDGAGAAGRRAGNGIRGMRERARALGGSLTAGRARTAASGVTRRLPCGLTWGRREPADPGPARRRPALVRAGFRSILDGEDDIAVVGEAADGAEAVRLARAAAARRGADGHPDARAGRPGGHPARSPPTSTRRRQGHHPDHVRPGRLRLRRAARRRQRLPGQGHRAGGADPRRAGGGPRRRADRPAVTRRLIAEFAGRATAPGPGPRLNALTEREREVMGLVAAGLSNDEIAARLVLSPATAKTHVSRIMTKLDVRDRSQLVVLAYESGLVSPGWLAD